jgi:hypothetical protein
VAKVLAGVLGSSAEFLFDTQNLIVFGQSFRAARSTGFNLSP